MKMTHNEHGQGDQVIDRITAISYNPDLEANFVADAKACDGGFALEEFELDDDLYLTGESSIKRISFHDALEIAADHGVQSIEIEGLGTDEVLSLLNDERYVNAAAKMIWASQEEVMLVNWSEFTVIPGDTTKAFPWNIVRLEECDD